MMNITKFPLIAFFLFTGALFAGTPVITSPESGGKFQGETLDLTWSPNGSTVRYYYLFVGTSQGRNNIHSRFYYNNTLKASINIPSTTDKVYVRFWYHLGGWNSKNYVFNRGVAGTPAKTSVCCFDGIPVPQATRERLATAGALGNAQKRWEATATNPGPIQRGDPITLTWSIVPDGSLISTFWGEPNSPSNLKQRLNQLFGNEATWKGLLQEVFDDWGRKTGITFVYTAQDDGVPFLNHLNHILNPGVLGVRGDIRIGGHHIDGNSGTLAYALHPDSGDVVFDTNDNFFDTPGINKEGLFKALMAHEIGHSLGLNHVCPNNSTKLMETLVSDVITGATHDEIIVTQRMYGDTLNNDTIPTAKHLGTAHQNALTVDTVSIDGSNDTDYFKFNISNANSKSRITLSPFGDIFEVGVVDNRTGGCLNQQTHNTKIRSKLSVQLIDSNGSTVLHNANSQPIGQNEVIIHTFAQTGDYYLKITGGSDACQPYVLNVETETVIPPYQNQNNRFDVNGDGNATVTDALVILNELNRLGAPGALTPPQGTVTKFYDVNGDNFISSIDALVVINEVARAMGF